jgi:hypothetical protein
VPLAERFFDGWIRRRKVSPLVRQDPAVGRVVLVANRFALDVEVRPARDISVTERRTCKRESANRKRENRFGRTEDLESGFDKETLLALGRAGSNRLTRYDVVATC